MGIFSRSHAKSEIKQDLDDEGDLGALPMVVEVFQENFF